MDAPEGFRVQLMGNKKRLFLISGENRKAEFKPSQSIGKMRGHKEEKRASYDTKKAFSSETEIFMFG